ncbi:hypothetical protein XAC3810_450031 [Xanthomonas citri pv. citri]|uniref:Uncharacterized protein n=1 Tax=Xanthomonas citri pv. citri TaxID=611301 RepID=A0A0U5FL31_XANCI|nr:hypothetical protein XAC9322_460029 [Xanthomonas citri pv. citri]CEE28992.1 hypothetical protein XAC3824_580028 [Xanthomonas citri pv. citri]CEE30602.1 hypothetical protein XAC1083_450029 [Xanthomonas citri pv. citri]CEE39813.1 hypothetical protein XAC3810_450031 [Xanthomonas citri pv. citri]CEE42094.1 hypothetical protein XAC902_620028 [Xanthomonas citri pv. citri]
MRQSASAAPGAAGIGRCLATMRPAELDAWRIRQITHVVRGIWADRQAYFATGTPRHVGERPGRSGTRSFQQMQPPHYFSDALDAAKAATTGATHDSAIPHPRAQSPTGAT